MSKKINQLIFILRKNKEIFFILLVANIFFFYSVNASIDGGDSATYLVGAKAISHGQGYTNISSPIPYPIQHFPPGYPVFLATAFLFMGYNVIIAKILNSILIMLSIFLFFEFSKKFFSKKISLLITATFAFDLAVLWYSHRILSEPLFVFVTLLTVLFLRKYFEEKNTFNKNFFITVILLILGFFVRSFGLTLIVATIIFFGIKKQFKKALAILAISLPAIFLWYLYSTATFQGAPEPIDSYIKQIFYIDLSKPELGFASPNQIVLRAFSNSLSYLIISIPRAIFPPLNATYFLIWGNFLTFDTSFSIIFTNLLYIAGILISIIFLLGFLINLKKDVSAVHIFLLFYLTLIVIIAYSYQAAVNRILLPLLPFLLIFFAKGLIQFIDFLNKKQTLFLNKNKVLFFIFGTMIFASVASDFYYVSTVHQREYDSKYRNLELAGEKLAEITTEKTLVFSDSPERLFLLSNVKSFLISSKEIETFKSKNGFDEVYVVLSAYHPNPQKVENSFPSDSEVIFVGEDNVTKVFKIK